MESKDHSHHRLIGLIAQSPGRLAPIYMTIYIKLATASQPGQRISLGARDATGLRTADSGALISFGGRRRGAANPRRSRLSGGLVARQRSLGLQEQDPLWWEGRSRLAYEEHGVD